MGVSRRMQSYERPQRFVLDEEICEIAAVFDQWYKFVF